MATNNYTRRAEVMESSYSFPGEMELVRLNRLLEQFKYQIDVGITRQ